MKGARQSNSAGKITACNELRKILGTNVTVWGFEWDERNLEIIKRGDEFTKTNKNGEVRMSNTWSWLWCWQNLWATTNEKRRHTTLLMSIVATAWAFKQDWIQEKNQKSDLKLNWVFSSFIKPKRTFS